MFHISYISSSTTCLTHPLKSQILVRRLAAHAPAVRDVCAVSVLGFTSSTIVVNQLLLLLIYCSCVCVCLLLMCCC